MTESPVDVAAIKAALKDATPAPWGLAEYGREVYALNGDEWPVSASELDGGCCNPADAELIVLLRNNVEALLNELEALRRAE